MIWFQSFFGEHDNVNRLLRRARPCRGERGRGSRRGRRRPPKTKRPSQAGARGRGAIYTHPDNHVMDDAHYAPKWVKTAPFIAMLLGLARVLVVLHPQPRAAGRTREGNQRPLYLFLLNKWYFDEIYGFLFVRPAMWLGRFLWKRGDGSTIDGALNGVAMGIVPFFTRLAGRAQSGYIFTYVIWMVVGIAVLITWVTIVGGAR